MPIVKPTLSLKYLIAIRRFKSMLHDYMLSLLSKRITYMRRLSLFEDSVGTIYAISPRKAYKALVDCLASLLRRKTSVYLLHIEIVFKDRLKKSLSEQIMFLVLEYAVALCNSEDLKGRVYAMFCLLDEDHLSNQTAQLYFFTDVYDCQDSIKELLEAKWDSHGVASEIHDRLQHTEQFLTLLDIADVRLYLRHMADEILDKSTRYVNFYDFTKEYGRHTHHEEFMSSTYGKTKTT